jgi:hypothetical protein
MSAIFSVQKLEDPCLENVGKISKVKVVRNIFLIGTSDLCLIRWDAANGISEKIEIAKPRLPDVS